MNSPAALEWLHADFEQGLQRYKRKLRHGALDREWRGPVAVRPMIQLRSPLGRCVSPASEDVLVAARCRH